MFVCVEYQDIQETVKKHSMNINTLELGRTWIHEDKNIKSVGVKYSFS